MKKETETLFNKKKRMSENEAASASVQEEKMPVNGPQEMDDEELSDVSGGFNPFGSADRVPLHEYDEQTRENL